MPRPHAGAPPAHGLTSLETLLKRDRVLVLLAVGLVVALCWAWIVPMARDMYGDMTGPSAWTMSGTWDVPRVLLLFGMWVAMMLGMMLPSTAPALLIYARVVRKSSESQHARRRTYAFAAGYVVVWTAFSAAATVIQRVLSEATLLSPMMEIRSRPLSAALLIVAGVYQLTPIKRACLNTCRSPLGFISARWRPGERGAFRMGLEHGAYCLGCCWALMLLLFAGGVMNLYVIATITLLVLLEKLAPAGAQGGRLSGGLLIAAGVAALAVA